MKLKIVKDLLILTDIYGPLQTPEGTIPLDDSRVKDKDDYRYEVAFGGNGDFINVENNKIIIPKETFNQKYTIIKVKQVHLSTRKEKIYATEELPVTQYLYLGEVFEEHYPRIITELKKQIKELDERLKNLEEEGDLL